MRRDARADAGLSGPPRGDRRQLVCGLAPASRPPWGSMPARLGQAGERAFLCFGILFSSGAFIGIPARLSGVTLESGDQILAATLARTVLLSGAVLLGAIWWRELLAALRQTPLIVAFFLIALASVSWSIAPAITLRRDISLLCGLFCGYYAVVRWPMVTVVRTLFQMTQLAGLSSAVVALTMPKIGVMSGDPLLAGAWNGVFMHKNQFGETMILGALAACWLAIHERSGRAIHVAGYLACLALTVMTRSTTAVISVMAVPPVMACTALLQLRGMGRVWALYLLALGGLLTFVGVSQFFETVTTAIGKDPSITGRAPLWEMLLGLIAQHPLLGYGYGAFFTAGNPDMDMVQRWIGWKAPEAHHSYLDLALALGIPGMLVAVLVILDTIRLAAIATARRSVAWAGMVLTFAVIFICTSFVETMLFNPGDIYAFVLSAFHAALRIHAANDRPPVPIRVRRPGGAGAGHGIAGDTAA